MAKSTKPAAKKKAIILTDEHLEANPELADQGYKIGDEYTPEDGEEETVPVSAKKTYEEFDVRVDRDKDNKVIGYTKIGKKNKDVRITERNAKQLNKMSDNTKVRYYEPGEE